MIGKGVDGACFAVGRLQGRVPFEVERERGQMWMLVRIWQKLGGLQKLTVGGFSGNYG